MQFQTNWHAVIHRLHNKSKQTYGIFVAASFVQYIEIMITDLKDMLVSFCMQKTKVWIATLAVSQEYICKKVTFWIFSLSTSKPNRWI